MSVINVNVIDQSLKITNTPLIASNGVKEDYIKFTFDSVWDGFSKVAVFYHAHTPETIYRSIVDVEGKALVPWEVTSKDGKIYFGVCGIKNDIVYTSEMLFYEVVKGAVNAGTESTPITPGIYEQILTTLENLTNSFVTPEMFGAVGDGVTDDYQAIQDCVDYAFAHNARVEFARKTYAVSDTVKLYGNCVYNGNNCTIKQTSDMPTMATYKYFDASKSGYHVTINDFYLEGNTSNAGNDGLVICGYYDRVNNVNVRNVGGHGIVATSFKADGNELSGSTLVEGMISNSKASAVGSGKYPFYQHCDNIAVTDWRVANCIFLGSDCPNFMKFDKIAGWFLTDVQCYGKAVTGIMAKFASGTQMENLTLDGITDTGIYFDSQIGSCNASNIHINVSSAAVSGIYAIRQTGGSTNPASLTVSNINVNVPSSVSSTLYLHRGSSYIFDVTNPVFIQNHTEIEYKLYHYKGANDVYRLNGFTVSTDVPTHESFVNLAKHYVVTQYAGESATLSLSITPTTAINRSAILVITGEVNGAMRGNSVYSVGLMRRGTTQPCKLVSEQSGYEFTNVGVTFDSATNTYTVTATTPNTGNCWYSMNVIY